MSSLADRLAAASRDRAVSRPRARGRPADARRPGDRPSSPATEPTRSASSRSTVHNRLLTAARPQAVRRRPDPVRARADGARRPAGGDAGRGRPASPRPTAPGSPRRSPTTSSATARSSRSCATPTSPRSWSTAATTSGSSAPASCSKVEGRFSDEAHLRRTIDKIVSRIGRRVDESSPMVDARLPDGSRVNAVIPPLAIDGSLLTIRKFSADPYTVRRPGRLRHLLAAHRGLPVRLRARASSTSSSPAAPAPARRRRSTCSRRSSPSDERIVTIEDAAELQLHQDHVLRLESRPANIEGKGAVDDPRPGEELAAHAPRPHRRRRGPRRRRPRHAPGDEHRSRRLDLHRALQRPARHPRPHRDDGADGRHGPADPRDPRAGGLRGRPDRAPDPAPGRLPADHPRHRGRADGGRRHHPPGHLPLRPLAWASTRTAAASAGSRPPACARSSSRSSPHNNVQVDPMLFAMDGGLTDATLAPRVVAAGPLHSAAAPAAVSLAALRPCARAPRPAYAADGQHRPRRAQDGDVPGARTRCPGPATTRPTSTRWPSPSTTSRCRPTARAAPARREAVERTDVLAIDVSYSMRRDNRFEEAKAAAKVFLDAAPTTSTSASSPSPATSTVAQEPTLDRDASARSSTGSSWPPDPAVRRRPRGRDRQRHGGLAQRPRALRRPRHLRTPPLDDGHHGHRGRRASRSTSSRSPRRRRTTGAAARARRGRRRHGHQRGRPGGADRGLRRRGRGARQPGPGHRHAARELAATEGTLGVTVRSTASPTPTTAFVTRRRRRGDAPAAARPTARGTAGRAAGFDDPARAHARRPRRGRPSRCSARCCSPLGGRRRAQEAGRRREPEHRGLHPQGRPQAGRGQAATPAPGRWPPQAVGGRRERAREQRRGSRPPSAHELEAAGMSLKPAEWLLIHAGVAFAARAPRPAARLAATCSSCSLGLVARARRCPGSSSRFKRSRRIKAFNAQLADTLQLMAGSLSAGLSLAQSVDTVVREGTDPMAGEFRRALVEARLGVEIEDALDGVAERMEQRRLRVGRHGDPDPARGRRQPRPSCSTTSPRPSASASTSSGRC